MALAVETDIVYLRVGSISYYGRRFPVHAVTNLDSNLPTVANKKGEITEFLATTLFRYLSPIDSLLGQKCTEYDLLIPRGLEKIDN